MSGPHINIATNSLGDGDWIIVEANGESVYSGHNIGVSHLFDILEMCNGFEFIHYYELTNEQLMEWPFCLTDEDIKPTRKAVC